MNADIQWSFSKRYGLLKNIPATSATAPMCKNCSRALPSCAANQQAMPAVHVRPISIRAVPVLIACDGENPPFVFHKRSDRGLVTPYDLPGHHTFSTFVNWPATRLDINNRTGLRVAWCLECLRVVPAGIYVCEEFFEPIERLGQIGQFFEAFAGVLYKEFCRFVAVE